MKPFNPLVFNILNNNSYPIHPLPKGSGFLGSLWVNELDLPEVQPDPDVTIDMVSNSTEYNELLDIFKEIFPSDINSEKEGELRSRREYNYKGVYIAKLNDEIIGFLMTGIMNFTGLIGYILYLGVLKEYRSKGIATLLLNRFKEKLKEKNIPKIQAKIRKDNQLVLNYIKFLGFKRIEKEH
ncbi:MAG: GNAT family N-acetyltransferase [Candidatus Lokiarchaeota archaeon]|nr:GNAT family N-acetyltransferase [Candidatus Lokiarchaeota archaeon]